MRQCLAILVLALPALAQTPDQLEFFEKNIRPVLASNCYGCHSTRAKVNQGGLALDSREAIRAKAKSGIAAVVPGKPDESLLIRAIAGTNKDLKMPPGKVLPAETVEKFREWVKMGAPDPREGVAPPPPVESSYNWPEARKHWAYQPITNPKPPAVADPLWSKSPIDRWVKASLETHKLSPVPVATARTWLRRVTFDLTGLPPTTKEINDFVADTSSAAREKVIDRLLASPAYGERFGRHWLDVARYADTAGCNSDFPIRDAYRYRNYVIHSLNADKPFDEFLREQIAGDLLPAKDDEDRVENTIATGYIALSRRFASNKNEHHLTIDDTIDNIGKATMGLSVSCARCHDHKFDPIPQRDYYALYGIFDSTHYAFPGVELFPRPNGLTPIGNPEQNAKFRAWEKELIEVDEKLYALRNERPAPNGKRTQKEIDDERRDWNEKMRRLYTRVPSVPRAFAVSELDAKEGKPHNAPILVKGDPRIKGAVVPRGFLTVLGGQPLPADTNGSGRLELARWITDPKNPLTARVIANRVWQWHMGKGLVQSPNDFGVRGEKPTHPELLDHLASYLVEHNWSLKQLSKYILISRVSQLAATHTAANFDKDPKNDWLWRFDRGRLDAEEIRDALLNAAGTLDRTMGGEHPFPAESTWNYTQHVQFFATYPTEKRSVYVMQQRQRKHPWFEVWDGADTNASTAVRPVSTTAIQSLTLMNDPMVHEQADKLAVRVYMAERTDATRIQYLWTLLYGRSALPADVLAVQAHLRKARAALVDTGKEPDQLNRSAWSSLMRVLLSSDEFLYVD